MQAGVCYPENGQSISQGGSEKWKSSNDDDDGHARARKRSSIISALGRGSEISLCSENRLRVGSKSGAQRKVQKSVKMWIFFVQAGVNKPENG